MKILLALFLLLTSIGSAEQSRAAFYHTSVGEKILDPSTYTQDIQKFLAEESKYILQLLSNYDVLCEIGCGSAARAIDVLNKKCCFYGIEINAHHIKRAREMIEQRRLGDRATIIAFNANELTPTTFPISKTKKSLIFFPFNLMGNLDDFHLVVANLIDIGEDFCFSTYKINPTAMSSRRAYYLNCGCNQLSYSATPIGDLYISPTGLHSAAFKISYLFELLETTLHSKEKKAKIFVNDLSDIGYMIYVKEIAQTQ